MLSEGFALLEERPGEELVLGTAGRLWRARGELCATSPVRFRALAPSGTAKSAWNFEVGLRADSATELRTEARVLCADVTTRRRFRAYWMVTALSVVKLSNVRRDFPDGGRSGLSA